MATGECEPAAIEVAGTGDEISKSQVAATGPKAAGTGRERTGLDVAARATEIASRQAEPALCADKPEQLTCMFMLLHAIHFCYAFT